MPKKHNRFLKETSDRSGFDNFDYDGTTFHKRWESVKQNGLTLEPVEFDTPPPSSIPLGGADITTGDQRVNSDTTTVPPISAQIIQYITAAGGISLNQKPWLIVTGSLQTINITANPQVQLGYQNQVIAIECVGSNVTLENGSGLSLSASRTYVMDSGSIINLICSRTDNLWHETSRSHRFRSLGEF